MGRTEEWVEADALVEPLSWGRDVYTVLLLSSVRESAARSARTRRVEGSVEDVAVNVGLNRADVLPHAFVYLGPSLQRRLGARPGDVVRYRLRPADPDEVPVPADVLEALSGAGLLAAFERRRPAQRRRLLQPVEDAARPETRQRRIAALLASVGPD